jgi:hypothetical protein
MINTERRGSIPFTRTGSSQGIGFRQKQHDWFLGYIMTLSNLVYYTASNCRLILKDKLERMKNELVCDLFYIALKD